MRWNRRASSFAQSAPRCLLALLSLLPCLALAGNGLNLIGFGTESIGLGGADTAVARDTTALNTNPAGLSRLARPRLDIYNAIAYALDVGHRDALGNDVEVSNRFIALGGAGYARPLSHGVTAGVGLFAQGGAGNVYKKVHTGFGNDDELSARFAILKLSAGASWKATDSLAVGLAVSALYSRLDQKIFPHTSVAGASPFFGLALDGVHGINGAVRAGLLYTPNARWTFGATFAPKSTLSMDRGRASLDMSAVGLGKVVFHDVHASGMALPREAAIGVSMQATPHTMFAVKLAWFDWLHAMRESHLTLGGAETSGAPATVRTVALIDWRNQTVIAIGVEHRLNDATTLRAGFNYGRNPAPASTMNPLLASIGERHFTAGASHRINADWEVAGAVEFLQTARIQYGNPSAPLGASAQERTHYVAVHAMISRHW